MSQQNPFESFQGQRLPGKAIFFGILVLLIVVILFAFSPFTTVPAGHVGVVSLFGKVDKDELAEGFHIINPLKKVHIIDCRNKQLSERDVGIPSQDQLTTRMDVTVKWRVDRSQAAEAYRETGNAEELQSVHLEPKVRSLVREAGKGIKRAEDFFNDEVQGAIQLRILEGLAPLRGKGILVEEVLMRDIQLPRQIVEGVEKKKRQEQAAEQQKAELERYKTEQQQKVAEAEAEREAAEQEALKRQALADAKAYEITAEAEARAQAIAVEGEALRKNPEVIDLRALEAWDGQLPRVLMGEGDAMPFIDIESAMRDQRPPKAPAASQP